MHHVQEYSGRVSRIVAVSFCLWGAGLLARAQQSALSVPPAAHRGGQAVASDGPTVGASLDALRGTLREAGPREKVLNLDSASDALIFPILGKIPNWSSDVVLINNRTTPQRVAFLFLQQGVNSGSSNPRYYTLPAQLFVFWHDFFGTGLGISGLGTIVVIGVDNAGNLDSSASIDGSARLYQTDAHGGTLSQMFPAVSFRDAPSGARTSAVGLRSDQQFRTNAGVVNPDAFDHTFTVAIASVAGVSHFNIAVPAYSMMQVALPNQGAYGDLVLQFTSDSGTFWSAYGASVDNISGDSWSSHAALAY